MKRLFILFFASVLMFTNCEDKKKDLNAKYDELIRQGDSIEVAHQDFMKAHNDMSGMHQNFSEQLASTEIKDSTVMEDIAKHEVILKRHDAILESHNTMFENHKNLKSDFDAMTDLEMEAKIAEMKDGHQQIMDEHAKMEDEHEMIMNEHESIKKTLSETQAEDSND